MHNSTDPTSPLRGSDAAWEGIPARMKVLHITTPSRPGGWLAEAFAADSAAQVVLEEAIGQAAGLARLRDEIFDALLVSHEPGELDAIDLVEGYRAGGAEEPIVVLGAQGEPEMAILCYEVGADAYLCIQTATTRHLIWTVARAVQRHSLIHENRRLLQTEHARLQREAVEAVRMVEDQRAIVEDGANSLDCLPLPPELLAHYRELLRTHVMMGQGNLPVELSQLAELLVSAGMSARQTVELHLEVVEEMVQGLGARSARHSMNRAGLMLLEMMIHVGAGYRAVYRATLA